MSKDYITRLARACSLTAFFFALPGVCFASESKVWEHYKSRFIQDDGRVIDYGNKQMSHSEGQSFTMYLALTFDEQLLFDKVWTWTRNNLMTGRDDGLAAWSWGHRDDGSWGVLDANDASDGDLFLAWTLLRAGERWKKPEYLEASRKIAGAIRDKLAVQACGRTVLLPGVAGFVKPGEVIFNPSYFIFPAFYDLARTGDPEFWRKLHASCLESLEKSLSGPLRLPPDWVQCKDGVLSPWGERGKHFSYDAIRTVLYLSWDMNRPALEGFSGLFDLFKSSGSLPARVSANQGIENQGDAPAGFYAILARAAETLGDGGSASSLWDKAESRLADEEGDYYSNVLFLMARTRGIR